MNKENDDQGTTKEKTLFPTNMTRQASVYKQEAHTLCVPGNEKSTSK